MIADKCCYCGKAIYLVRSRGSFRWMDNPKKPDSWGCGSDPVYKTMTHAPWEMVDAQNRARKVPTNDSVK